MNLSYYEYRHCKSAGIINVYIGSS